MKLFLIHTLAFAYRNAIFAKRNIFIVVEMLFWPIIGVLSIGLMGDFLVLEENALSFVLTGAIASGVLQVAQLDVGYSLLYDVWSKSLKHTFLAPVTLSSAMAGAWLIGMVRGSIVFVVLVLMSKFFFKFHLPSLPMTAVFLLGIFWMGLLVGITVWILILMFGQRAEVSVWALSYLVMILCGIYYPVDLLSGPFRVLGQMLPLTYFLDAYRSHYGFSPLFKHPILIGMILNLVYTGIALFLARVAMLYARKTGITVRLSE